jgi:NAD(P)-dependent dehydrogenase (short-subunit alcohol dehydrogenase family)
MTRKTAVITGCSSGFGRCTALELAKHGWLVFATVRKDDDRAWICNCYSTLASLPA